MIDTARFHNKEKREQPFSASPTARRVLPALGIVLIISLSSVLKICDLLFGCGCLSLWAGGTMYCDVVVAGPPDCPFCMGGVARQLALAGTALASIVFSVLVSARRTQAGVVSLSVVGTLAYIAAIVAAGALLAAIDGSDRYGAFLRDLPPPQHLNAR